MPPNPAELLQSQTMQTTLDKLRGRYDLIIIDAPPLLPVTDAAVLATQADGAILVVRHGKTSREQVSEASKRLESVDAKTFGAVLNMVPGPRRQLRLRLRLRLRVRTRQGQAEEAATVPGRSRTVLSR